MAACALVQKPLSVAAVTATTTHRTTQGKVRPEIDHTDCLPRMKGKMESLTSPS